MSLTSKVVSFRHPSGGTERTSMKEHLVSQGNKRKVQLHTTKRKKQQQKQKQTRLSRKRTPENG